MMSPLLQAQAWPTPSFCPPGALPSLSRGRGGSQWPETAIESGIERRAPMGTRPPSSAWLWPNRAHRSTAGPLQTHAYGHVALPLASPWPNCAPCTATGPFTLT
jgi:hypothetical protein